MTDRRSGLVTAAGNGIGRAVALDMAREGYQLLLFDIDEAGLAETERGARAMGADVTVVRVDCTDEAQIKAGIGGRPIDILVNGVGSSLRSRARRFIETTPDLWDWVLNVSLRSAMLCAHTVVSGMCDRRYGRIVNFTSDAFLRPTKRLAEYAAAKGGIVGFTRGLATEFGEYGVTANAIAPGLIATTALDGLPDDIIKVASGQTLLGRPGRAEEVSHIVLALVHERASYITGQTITVNGGRTLN